jgi:hypothetical protein
MVKGLLLAIVLSSATVSAQPINLDVHVDVDVSPAPDEPAPPPPRRYVSLSKLWSFRDGDGYRLDIEVARGPLHHRQGMSGGWIAGVGAAQLDERTPYYGHDDDLQIHDTAFTGFFAGALRFGRFEARGGLSAGVERTTGMQTSWMMARDVSSVAPLAELYTQCAFDLGPVTAMFGERMIVHAEHFGTLDGMDSFTREPSLVAYLGLATSLD